MSRADLVRQLFAAKENRCLTRVFHADLVDGWASGFVLDIDSVFFSFALVDKSILFDGQMVMRLSSVTKVESPAPNAGFVMKALSARYPDGVQHPPIDISTLAAVLESGARGFPLVAVHFDHDDVCFIGEFESLAQEKLRLRLVTPDGRWGERRDFDAGAISRFEFGGKYEEALHLVANLN